jgi:hypothetical protein
MIASAKPFYKVGARQNPEAQSLSVNTCGGQVLIRYLRQFYQSKLNLVVADAD